MPASAIIPINVAAVPDFRSTELAECALRLTKSLFSRSEVENEYQEWLAARKRKRGGEKHEQK